MLGTALWLQGRVAESAAVLDDGIDGARLLENVQGLAWNLFNRGPRGDRGRRRRAGADARDGEPRALRRPGRATHRGARRDDARVAAARDRAGRAGGERHARAHGRAALRAIPGAWRAYSLELLTRCELAAGRPAEAARAAAEAQACADTFARCRWRRGMAARARAAVALHAGDAAGAAELALRLGGGARRASPTSTTPRSRARSRDARSRRRASRTAPPRELERAADAFASFGSMRQHAAVEQELRKLGRRIHHRTRAGSSDELGVASLTGRELEVARLIVDRKTNAQIAGRAVSQPEDRRVAHPQHVSQARRQLARRARPRGRARRPRRRRLTPGRRGGTGSGARDLRVPVAGDAPMSGRPRRGSLIP